MFLSLHTNVKMSAVACNTRYILLPEQLSGAPISLSKKLMTAVSAKRSKATTRSLSFWVKIRLYKSYAVEKRVREREERRRDESQNQRQNQSLQILPTCKICARKSIGRPRVCNAISMVITEGKSGVSLITTLVRAAKNVSTASTESARRIFMLRNVGSVI